MIYVIATIEVNDGKRDDFITHFKALVPSVHAEAYVESETIPKK